MKLALLLRLYPAKWRERYGEEIADLLAAEPPSFSRAVDMLRGVIDAHLHPELVYHRALAAVPAAGGRSAEMASAMSWFDHQTKHALAMAQAAAVGLNHGGLGAEHLLIGILSTQCAARSALESISVDAERAQVTLRALVPPGEEPVRPQDIALTPAALGAIDRANTLRQREECADLTPTLLLLALVADEENVATKVLAKLGATPDRVRKALTTH